VVERDKFDRIGVMFEVMHGEEQPAAGEAPGGRGQSSFPEAILEGATLDAACRCHLLHAERILGVFQATLECCQELWRHATLQFLENPLCDSGPVSVRHHSSQRGEKSGAHSGSRRFEVVTEISILASSQTFGSGVLRKLSLSIARLELDAVSELN
jgi:hypothetical protein